MPRIGILFEYASLNGGERSLLAVLDAVADVGRAVVGLGPADGRLPSAFQERGLDWDVLTPEGGFAVATDPRVCAERFGDAWRNAVLAACDRHQLQLLHANSLSMARRLGRIAAQLPCPATGHLRDMLRVSGAAMQGLNALASVIAVSQACADFHIQQGLHEQRVQVIHNGINLDEWSLKVKTGGRLRAELELSEETQLAITIGQICLRKGQQDLAEAAVQLRDQFPYLHFLIVGERYSTKPESIDYERVIRQTFEAAGMGDRLHLLGYRRDVREILQEADLLIHAARQEPLGRVLLEAAACSVPIVATDVGGTREIVVHEESALLVPPASPAALSAAIARLMGEEPLRRRLGSAARRRMQQRFAIEVAAARTCAFWSRHAEASL